MEETHLRYADSPSMGNHHDHEDLEVETARHKLAEARLSRRSMYSGMSLDALAILQDQAWQEHSEITDRLLALAEETLGRIVSENVENAATIVLREDNCHGSPHGHLHLILDAEGHVVLDGASEDWHHLSWSGPVDDYAWEIHHLGKMYFSTDKSKQRTYSLPVQVPED